MPDDERDDTVTSRSGRKRMFRTVGTLHGFDGQKAERSRLPRALVYDLVERRVVVTTRENLMIEAPMPTDARLAWDGVSRIRIDVDARVQTLTLRDGAQLKLELGGTGRDQPPTGVPIAYLDQNQWIALARSQWSPDRLTEPEREAGRVLAQLAKSGRLILPVSSAHLAELPALELRRHKLVLTMLELSRGWQMRSPLAVRRQELRGAMAGKAIRCRDVFTLEPGAMFDDSVEWNPTNEFPPATRDLLTRVVASHASVAAMLEEDSPEDITGLDERRRWLQGYSEQAKRLTSAGLSKAETHALAHAVLLQDMKSECAGAAAAVGLGGRQLREWVSEKSQVSLERAPHIRVLGEVLYHRFRNSQDRWEENDLFDMQFLTVAAGYADMVVAEKKFGDYLTRARRRYPEAAPVVTSLAAAAAGLGASQRCRAA